MKNSGATQTFKFVKLMILSSAVLVATGASAFDHSGMHGPPTKDGSAYLLPKSLSVHSFNSQNHPSIGTFAGTIFISEKGDAKLHMSNPKVASLRALDKKLSKELLGVPVGPQGEEQDKPYFWTFNVLTMHAFEENIYHIDVQFADADQHWKQYRIRGYQITNPQWQKVM